MKTPKRLQPLIDDGLIDAVVRPLRSGKEAAVFVVRRDGETLCAKVYKAAENRGFRTRTQYREGRTVRNSRRARAMERGTRYGRAEEEAVWQTAEVEALYRLADAGVRVPQPYQFLDGVLLMELVTDADGHAAPRLGDVVPDEAEARRWHGLLMRDAVRMLCAGLIHGDLSEYNVLLDADGPVIIDLPQAVDAAGNNNACRLFVRDVDNLTAFFGRHAPALADTDYAGEIWAHYEAGNLTPEIALTGQFEPDRHTPDVAEVLRAIEAAREEALERARGERGDADDPADSFAT